MAHSTHRCTSRFLTRRTVNKNLVYKATKGSINSNALEAEKCIYGLIDGPRKWYIALRRTLEDLGMTVSSYDESFFFGHQGEELAGLIAI